MSEVRGNVVCESGKRFALLCFAFTWISLTGSHSLAQVIANPSFETPSLLPGEILEYPVGAAWQFNQGSSSFYSSGVVAYDALEESAFQPIAPPPDGDQFGYMRSGSSIQQTVSGFSVGEAYRLDWYQGYGGTSASGGSALQVEIQPSGGGVSQLIAPLELANSPSLASRSSDVFIATSESYEITVQSSAEVPYLYASRNALVDQFAVVPVNENATTRATYSTSLAITSVSGLEVDALLGGVALGADIQSAVAGSINLEFDIANGTDVVSLRFNESNVQFNPTLTGFIDAGPLGTANVSLTDTSGMLFHVDGGIYGKQSVGVNSAGEFLLGSAFFDLEGLAEIDLTGPIVDVLGADMIEYDLSDVAAADLGITYLGDQALFADPGTIDLSPTGNPNEYLVTVDVPVFIVTPLASSIGLEVQVSGMVQAQGIVIVPEPSSIALAFLGGLMLLLARARRLHS